MKRLLIFLAVTSTVAALGLVYSTLHSVNASQNQISSPSALDRYGGSTRLRCTNTTGHFALVKLGNRWWFCDPLGNAFISMSVGGVGTPGKNQVDCKGSLVLPILQAKYGNTTYNWGLQTLKRMTSWGFNSVGQDSVGFVQPGVSCPRCSWPGRRQPIPLPYLKEDKPAEYASINRLGYLTEAIKDMIAGTNNNYSTWRGGALFDGFDPKLGIEWEKELQNANNAPIRSNDPYLLGVFTDDSDYFWGSGAGPDFPTGHTNANVGWVTLITSPVQTYNPGTAFGDTRQLYRTTQIFTKTLTTNPVFRCSILSPCSLRDYLWQKYEGNISKLDKAWGATYTSFDSTGKQVESEVVGAADGAKRVFVYTLTHTPVSPHSLLLSAGGVAIAGDCPWFHRGCGTATKNLGTIAGPASDYIVQSSSSINYSTGAVTLAFANPPSRGSMITISYVSAGWMAGGTGLADEDGSHTAWVGTNPFCLEGANHDYPTYFTCAGGGAPHNPVPNANPVLGADLDDWVSQFSAKFFKTMHNDLRAVSNVPYLGLDLFGSWGGPAYSKFMEGATPYIDGAFMNIKYWLPAPSPAVFESAYQYITRYIGDVPLLNFAGIYAQGDSSMHCYSDAGDPNNFPHQADRGEQWYNTVNYLLTTRGFNHDYPFVGFDWWTWQDFQNLNQGLVSLHDNAYDGHEDVIVSVPCSAPLETLVCGGEMANYGNAIGKITEANDLWYKLLP